MSDFPEELLNNDQAVQDMAESCGLAEESDTCPDCQINQRIGVVFPRRCPNFELKSLDGMAGVMRGVAKQRFPHTMDARVWAQEWLSTIERNPNIAQDEETMISWFANAIMVGYDTASYQLTNNLPHE